MKKLVCLILFLSFLLCGCGATPAEKSTDELFLEAFKAGLMGRWDITLQSNYRLADAINEETKRIAPFADAEFTDQHLGELARGYIEAVNEQKNALSYETVDYFKYSTLFTHGYNRRIVLISQICNEYDVSFPSKYDEAYNSIIQSAPAAERTLSIEDAVAHMLDNAVVKIVDGSSKWKKYSVTLKNEGEYDIQNLSVQIQIYDDDHAVIDTCYCDNLKELRAGETAKVNFSTDKDFVEYVLYADYY